MTWWLLPSNLGAMATARLKRRLEMDGRELDSRSVTQSFVTYGAPLPALTDKRDDGEFKPLHEQTVGRLHGAFTGGWSAGYFNTVGSKEGALLSSAACPAKVC